MRTAEQILLVHDDDPIGIAVADLIREKGVPLRELPGTVSRWPKWAVAALRAIGRAPLELPDGLKTAPADEDLSMLHPGPWQTLENVVLNPERRHEHAMGM